MPRRKTLSPRALEDAAARCAALWRSEDNSDVAISKREGASSADVDFGIIKMATGGLDEDQYLIGEGGSW